MNERHTQNLNTRTIRIPPNARTLLNFSACPRNSGSRSMPQLLQLVNIVLVYLVIIKPTVSLRETLTAPCPISIKLSSSI